VEWWNGSMATRLNDFSTGHKIVVMQRLHQSDLTGDLLAKGSYDLLCLPAEFEPERRCTTSLGWSDPRQEAGELLWPGKVSRDDLAGLKITLGSYRYAANINSGLPRLRVVFSNGSGVAQDPQAKILYAYSEYDQSHAEPVIHAHGILSRGNWIRGVIDLTCNGRSRSDGLNLMRIYEELGLRLDCAADSEQSGVSEVLQLMKSGRLKVYRTLENLFREYRLYRRDEYGQTVKQNDLLMSCLRILCVSGRGCMRKQPTRKEFPYRTTITAGRPGGWMG
jgi:hypothetical protein